MRFEVYGSAMLVMITVRACVCVCVCVWSSLWLTETAQGDRRRCARAVAPAAGAARSASALGAMVREASRASPGRAAGARR